MYRRSFDFVSLILVVIFLMACNRVELKNTNALEIKKDNDIHYEHVNEDGLFVDHKIYRDPMSDQYSEGIATPNNLSSYETIHGDGEGNRINLVVVGDGYAPHDMNTYKNQTENIIGRYFTEEPLQTYQNYFNVHRVDVVSRDSGVDNDPNKGSRRSTALDMGFHCYNTPRMLCINIQKAKRYAANAPKVDQILALANSSSYGGTGYWNDQLATMSGGNSSAIELALHELAHSLAQLGDEYDYAGSDPKACLNKANGSILGWASMLMQKTKWYRWLDLPHIGAFEGTCYKASAAYRPTHNSKMRTLGVPFYEVNTEQYIFEIYKRVKPIQWATEPGTYPKNRILRVQPLQPVGHDLQIKWYVNGQEIAESDQKLNFSVASLRLPAGRFTISVKVSDMTSKVRDEDKRQKLMTETRTWTVL